MKFFAGISFVLALVYAPVCQASTINFTFDDLTPHTTLPLDYTVSGLTGHFSATGVGFSIQDTNSALGFLPTGAAGTFSGNSIYQNTINLTDLMVTFSQPLTDVSILYAVQDLNVSPPGSTMRVTAFVGGLSGSQVGTSTTVAPEGSWPTALLNFSSATGFDSLVIHYDKTPPNASPEDYGTVFLVDDILVTTSANGNVVPLPGALPLFATGLSALGLLGWRRKKKAAALTA
jgi:hypothetical protein